MKQTMPRVWMVSIILVASLSTAWGETTEVETILETIEHRDRHLFEILSGSPPAAPKKQSLKGTAPTPSPVPGVLGIDLFPGNPHFAGNSTGVYDEDFDIDTLRSATRGEVISTVVRLNDTEDLLGVTFDFVFDNERLRVNDIRETRMDLDFSGNQSFIELQAVADFFFSNELPDLPPVDGFAYTYDDGTGEITTNPGMLLDLDGDGVLSFIELQRYAFEFLSNLDETDIPFWTEIVARRPGFNESVEVFDLPKDANEDGRGSGNTVVLLRRPTVPALDFGFDGNAILFEIVFQVKEDAPLGEAFIRIENAEAIDERFSDIATDTRSVQTMPGGATIMVE